MAMSMRSVAPLVTRELGAARPMPAAPGSLRSLPELLDLPVSVAADAIAITRGSASTFWISSALFALRRAPRCRIPLGDRGVVDAWRLCDRRLLLVGERALDDASLPRRRSMMQGK
jgi:hypothetical protein